MRKSFDGLIGLVQGTLREDVLSGSLFVFFNRRATIVKLVFWDRTGFCVFAKSSPPKLNDTSVCRSRSPEWNAMSMLSTGRSWKRCSPETQNTPLGCSQNISCSPPQSLPASPRAANTELSSITRLTILPLSILLLSHYRMDVANKNACTLNTE